MSTNVSEASRNLKDTFQSVGKPSSNFADDLLHISQTKMNLLTDPILGQAGITKETKEPVVLLDNCCGSGVVRQEVEKLLSKDVLEKSTFVCADNSAGMIDVAKSRIENEGWANTETKVVDAADTGLPDDSFTHVIVCLGLHITPDPAAVLKDAKRILKPGGVFAGTTFHIDNKNKWWGPDTRDAFASFPFEAPFPEDFPLQMHDVGDWSSTAWVESFFKEQGLKDVEVREVVGTTHMDSAEDFVKTFSLMLPWLMKTWWSEETRAQHPLEEVKELIRVFLEKKYEGKGWDIQFKTINASGRV